MFADAPAFAGHFTPGRYSSPGPVKAQHLGRGRSFSPPSAVLTAFSSPKQRIVSITEHCARAAELAT